MPTILDVALAVILSASDSCTQVITANMRCDSDPVTGREYNCGSEAYQEVNPPVPPPLIQIETEDGIPTFVPESV